MSDTNRFKITGTLNRIDTFTTKANKTMLTLVLDFDKNGKYPQLVPIKIFGDLAKQASGWKPGDVLAVSGRLGGRDYNGKVYGDIVAETVDVMSGKDPLAEKPVDEPPQAGDDESSLPF